MRLHELMEYVSLGTRFRVRYANESYGYDQTIVNNTFTAMNWATDLELKHNRKLYVQHISSTDFNRIEVTCK